VVAGGEPRIITTRNTSSGQPVRSAVRMVFERFQELGLSTRYTNWSASGYANTNVIATLPGGALSNELVLITAHLDNMPTGSRAPGADDNASGSAAVLTAAGIMSQYCFDRTIRYILFTGEEQGLLGSAKYAAAAKAAGDNIVGVLNLDMIAWNTNSPDTFQLYTRTNTAPGYASDLLIATTFTNAAVA
jgi:Zn-dependent M28 family amino/carboxypeptidase